MRRTLNLMSYFDMRITHINFKELGLVVTFIKKENFIYMKFIWFCFYLYI